MPKNWVPHQQRKHLYHCYSNWPWRRQGTMNQKGQKEHAAMDASLGDAMHAGKATFRLQKSATRAREEAETTCLKKEAIKEEDNFTFITLVSSHCTSKLLSNTTSLWLTCQVYYQHPLDLSCHDLTCHTYAILPPTSELFLALDWNSSQGPTTPPVWSLK